MRSPSILALGVLLTALYRGPVVVTNDLDAF